MWTEKNTLNSLAMVKESSMLMADVLISGMPLLCLDKYRHNFLGCSNMKKVKVQEKNWSLAACTLSWKVCTRLENSFLSPGFWNLAFQMYKITIHSQVLFVDTVFLKKRTRFHNEWPCLWTSTTTHYYHLTKCCPWHLTYICSSIRMSPRQFLKLWDLWM